MNDDPRRSADMDDDELFDDGPEEEAKDLEVDIGDPDGGMPGIDIEGSDQDLTKDDAQPDAADKTKEPAKQADGDDDTEYSQKVQKRINREVAKRKTVETELERIRRENLELRQGMSSTRVRAVETSISELTGRANALRSQMSQALDAGDTDKYLELNDQLVDTRAHLLNAQAVKSRMAPPVDPQQQQPQPQTYTQAQRPDTGQPPAPDVSRAPKLAQGWIADRDFLNWSQSEKAFAGGVDAELTAEGYDVETPEYFQEMDRRIQAAMPHLYDDAPAGSPGAKTPTAPRKNTGAAAPVAAPSDVTPGGKPQGKVKLTQEDLNNMRRFGLDPEDPNQLKEYARNKQAS